MLALLRLADIYDHGLLNVMVDRTVAADFFKRAAMVQNVGDCLCKVQTHSPEDAAFFIALMCKAFLIASESGKYQAHSKKALFWFQVLRQLRQTKFIDDTDLLERLERQVSDEHRVEAGIQAIEWLARAL